MKFLLVAAAFAIRRTFTGQCEWVSGHCTGPVGVCDHLNSDKCSKASYALQTLAEGQKASGSAFTGQCEWVNNTCTGPADTCHGLAAGRCSKASYSVQAANAANGAAFLGAGVVLASNVTERYRKYLRTT